MWNPAPVLCYPSLGLLIVFQSENQDQDEYMLKMVLTFGHILDIDSRTAEARDHLRTRKC